MSEQIFGDDPVLIVRLPTQLSDEAASCFCEFFFEVAVSIEKHYDSQIKRHWETCEADMFSPKAREDESIEELPF